MGPIAAFQAGAAWADLSDQGRLRATGEDRARLLHAICSNDVENLAAGEGTYAFFLSPQGKIQADSHIFVRETDVLVVCEPGVRERLASHIESYIIMDDVLLEDISGQSAVLGVAGPEAGRVVSTVCPSAPARPLRSAEHGSVVVRWAPVAGHDGYWLETEPSAAPGLQRRLERIGAVRASAQDCETARVLRGVPRFGPDFGGACIPHETQLMGAVSFDKGCYTGQEIVERVRSQGRVRRLLVAVELDAAEPPNDRTVTYGGRKVGTLTSPVASPTPGERGRGFAILRREAAIPGTRVTVGACRATVAALGRP